MLASIEITLFVIDFFSPPRAHAISWKLVKSAKDCFFSIFVIVWEFKNLAENCIKFYQDQSG